jgi:hypothetical protein
MIKVNAVAAKEKTNGRDEQPLDTSRMQPIKADSAPKPAEITNISNVAS